MKPLILVTGATGKTGGAVVSELLKKEIPVRALVHKDDARGNHLARLGAEVVKADGFDFRQMKNALKGVKRAYYVPVFHPQMLQSATVFSLAAQENKLESVVQLGQWLSHSAHPTSLTAQTWLVDQSFSKMDGVAHTIINPGLFADNFLRILDMPSLLGFYPIITGNGKCAPVSNDDIARVAVAALLEPEIHAGKSYRPTGPKLLNGEDMAHVISSVLAHRVIPCHLPFWLFEKVASQQSINPMEIAGLQFYAEEMRRGSFELFGGVTNVVEELTGKSPESFETIAKRYAKMPFAQKTMKNRLRALVTVSLAPFASKYALKDWQYNNFSSNVSDASFSLDDQIWLQEHKSLMESQFDSLDQKERFGGLTNVLA